MSIRIKEVFVTDDNKEHSTREMAEHWEMLKAITKALESSAVLGLGTHHHCGACDIVNWIDDNQNLVRAYIDASTKTMKASMQ